MKQPGVYGNNGDDGEGNSGVDDDITPHHRFPGALLPSCGPTSTPFEYTSNRYSGDSGYIKGGSDSVMWCTNRSYRPHPLHINRVVLIIFHRLHLTFVPVDLYNCCYEIVYTFSQSMLILLETYRLDYMIDDILTLVSKRYVQNKTRSCGCLAHYSTSKLESIVRYLIPNCHIIPFTCTTIICIAEFIGVQGSLPAINDVIRILSDINI